MRKTRILASACLLFVFACAVSAQSSLYVATDGDDSNSGTISQPLKTLKGARDKVRSVGASGGVTIYFRGGRYPITETVTFNSQDGGSSLNPVIYTSYNNETVFFDGSLFISPGGFTSTTSNYLKSSASGKVYVKTITNANEINALKSLDAQISFNDKMMNMSRFPNLGYAHIDDGTINASVETPDTEGTQSNPKGSKFNIHETIDINKWSSEFARTKNMRIKGYVSADWLKEVLRISNVGSDGRIRLMDGSKYGIEDRSSPNRLFFSHVLCELDEAGEWYFDESDNKLYIWPYETINSDTKIGVWAGPQMALIDGASNLNFEKIKIQCIGSGSNGDGAINVRNGNNINIKGVIFRYIAEPVTACNFWQNAKNSSMQSCDFFDIWNSTRLYGGSLTGSNITKGNNKIENCHFTMIYSKDFYGKVTGISGAGNIFRNNLVHNTNGQPITNAGVDHLIELNEIFNVGVEEGDGGAIYAGANIMDYGTIIRHNFIHHILSVPSLVGRSAIHHDGLNGGKTTEENVIYKGGWVGVKLATGAGHTVRKNVFLETNTGIKERTPKASDYTGAMEYLDRVGGKDPNANASSNFMGKMLKVAGKSGWYDNANSSNWYNQINSYWKNRYPVFDRSMRAYFDNQKMDAYECYFIENMNYDLVTDVFLSGTNAQVQNPHSINLSIFNDPNTLHFKFNANKPVYAPNIPFDKIGLYEDEYRCAVPHKGNYRTAVKSRFSPYKSHGNGSYNRNTINNMIYYNSGKMVTDLIPCINDVNNGDGSPGDGTNLALNKPATQSSDYNSSFQASVANNGSTSDFSHTNNDANAWWQVDLQSVSNITNIKVYNREGCCQNRLANFYVLVSDVPFTSTNLNTTRNQSGVGEYYTSGQADSPTTININRTGRYVRVQLAGTNSLHPAEIEVFGTEGTPCTPSTIIPYLQVDGAAFQNVSNVSITSGQVVRFGPHPTTGGSWSWSGCSNTSTQRDPSITPTSTCTTTATFTDNCGAQSQQAFTINVTSAPVGQSPYGGNAHPIPGTIEAENYDIGGEGVAYHDVTSGNSGNQVRTEDVDIEARDGGYNVGWTANDEWLEYTVNAASGTYNMTARVATTSTNKKIKVELDGVVLGTFTAPNTGNWGTFQTITINNVSISGGNGKILRFTFDGGGINLNWIGFEAVANIETNVAINKATSQSSNNYTIDKGWAHEAADGNTSGVFNNLSVTHTKSNAQAWWQVDLGGVYNITEIKVYNRTDCCEDRLSDFHVFVSDNAFSSTNLNTTINQSGVGNYFTSGTAAATNTKTVNRSGRYVRVQLSGTNILSLAEVEIISTGLKSADDVSYTELHGVNMYPNPASDLLFVNFVDIVDKTSLLVYNLQGSLVLSESISTNTESLIDVSSLSKGMYTIHIKGSQGNFNSKLIIK